MPAPRVFDPIPNGKWRGPVVAAIKALAEGQARPDQQIAALNFIIDDLAGLYDEAFRPDDRETGYALGRAYVGRQLRKCIMQPFKLLTGQEQGGEQERP